MHIPKSLVVYTAVYGDGYTLPAIPSSETTDFVCFTDQPALEPNGWRIENVEPTFPLDLARSSREQKIRPHRWFKDYERSIYIDPSVRLVRDPEELWRALTEQREEILFAGIYHSYRERLLDEFAAVMEAGLDEPDRVYSAINELALSNPELLHSKPVWGAILARRHNDPECELAMEHWYSYVMRYSRRDQLSLPIAITKIEKQKYRLQSFDNFRSDFHDWPVTGYQRPQRYYASAQEILVAPLLSLEKKTIELKTEREERRQIEEHLRNEIERASSQIRELEASRGLRLTRSLGRFRSRFGLRG